MENTGTPRQTNNFRENLLNIKNLLEKLQNECGGKTNFLFVVEEVFPNTDGDKINEDKRFVVYLFILKILVGSKLFNCSNAK